MEIDGVARCFKKKKTKSSMLKKCNFIILSLDPGSHGDDSPLYLAYQVMYSVVEMTQKDINRVIADFLLLCTVALLFYAYKNKYERLYPGIIDAPKRKMVAKSYTTGKTHVA